MTRFTLYLYQKNLYNNKVEHFQQFLLHLNSLIPHIQFTTEVPSCQGCIPFLDTLLSLGPNGSLITSVYRKPTYTEKYFHWDSHHSISAKYGVFNTLTHMPKTVCSDKELLQQEQLHIRMGLRRCNYPNWDFH